MYAILTTSPQDFAQTGDERILDLARLATALDQRAFLEIKEELVTASLKPVIDMRDLGGTFMPMTCLLRLITDLLSDRIMSLGVIGADPASFLSMSAIDEERTQLSHLIANKRFYRYWLRPYPESPSADSDAPV